MRLLRGTRTERKRSPLSMDSRKLTAVKLATKVGISYALWSTHLKNGVPDMIDDPKVDVIYNPLPNGLHFEWTMKALEGGKHVLLEKPATDTAEESEKIFTLAAKKNLVVLEAFHYR